MAELLAAREELRHLQSMESSSELVLKQLAGFEKKIANMDASATGAYTHAPCSRWSLLEAALRARIALPHLLPARFASPLRIPNASTHARMAFRFQTRVMC